MGTALRSLLMGRGKGNFLLGLGERERLNEKVGVVCSWSHHPADSVKLLPAWREGTMYSGAVRSERPAGLCSARGRTQGGLQRREDAPAPSPLRLASWHRRLGKKGRPPGPEGPAAAPITWASGRWQASQRSAKPGAEGAAVRRPLPVLSPGRLTLLPATSTTEEGARVGRQLLFTLKSRCSFLGVSRG